MKFIISLIAVIGFSISLQSQNVNVGWALSVGASGYDYGYSMTMDNEGNLYILGVFELTVDFDPGDDVYNVTSSIGGKDLYIQKLNSDGNFQWVKTVGGAWANFIGTDITLDSLGNIIVTGLFNGTADFNPGTDSLFYSSNGPELDGFVLKLDNEGGFLWTHVLDGQLSNNYTSIAVDSINNIYLTGEYQDTIDFDPGSATLNLISNGGKDIFIQKLNSEGELIWVKSLGGSNDSEYQTDRVNCITLNSSEGLYISGSYYDTVDFDPGTNEFGLTSNGGADGFVLKLNLDGEFIWAFSLGGIEDDYCNEVKIDHSEKLVIIGVFQDLIDIDPGTDEFNLSSIGNFDGYILKTNLESDFIWARSFGGTGNDGASNIDFDSLNNIYLTGNFEETVDFDPGTAVYNLTSVNQPDIFVLKLDSIGEFKWVKNFTGGTSLKSPGSIIVNEAGSSIYLNGTFTRTVHFDPNSENFDLTSIEMSFDAFIVKLQEESNVIKEISDEPLLSIYPNPSDGHLTIEFKSLQEVDIKMFNLSGQVVYSQEGINAISHQFEVDEPSGIYILEISSPKFKQYYKVFLE